MEESATTPLRAILLDVDGTLLDSVQAHAEAWCEALAAEGIVVSAEQIRPLVGMGGDKLLPEVAGIDVESARGKRIDERRGETFRTRHLPHLRPFAEVRRLLQALRDRGLRLVVATSASKEDLGGLLARAGVKELVDDCASGDTAERSKPDPDIVLAALKTAHIGPDEAILLGDTPYDIEAARRAGVPCIAVRCGGWDDDGLAGAIAVFEDPAHLLAHLDDSPIGGRLDTRRRPAS
jgi:HAD superfamily hydrolase (TIGR01509 family)